MRWYVILIILLLIPSVSAVELLNGTVLNATISNSTMTFEGCELNVTQSVVSNISIELSNATYLPPGQPFTLPAFINFTDENSNIDCLGLGPRFGTSTDQGILFCDGLRDSFGGIDLTNFISVYGIVGITFVLIVATILILIFIKRDQLDTTDGVEEILKIAGLVILGMGVIALLLIITIFIVEVTCIP